MNCKYVSRRPSEYQELELPTAGQPDLASALSAYFAIERLEGDNKYHCGNCKQHQDAERRIVLETLPDVLSFNLLRF